MKHPINGKMNNRYVQDLRFTFRMFLRSNVKIIIINPVAIQDFLLN